MDNMELTGANFLVTMIFVVIAIFIIILLIVIGVISYYLSECRSDKKKETSLKEKGEGVVDEVEQSFGASHCSSAAQQVSASVPGKGIGGGMCRSNYDAYLEKCLNTGDPSCCAVCIQGESVRGTTAANGACQTANQQALYSGSGLQPPNTYEVDIGRETQNIALGSCHVRPMTSSSMNSMGYFDNQLVANPVDHYIA